MPRLPVPASGGAPIIPYLKKSIQAVQFGCRNRPFYHIVVTDVHKDKEDRCIEQVGSYDPMPNERNEKVVAFNYERIRFWMGEGVALSDKVAELLGLAGFLPINPRSYMHAWRLRGEIPAAKVDDTWDVRRQEILEKAAKLREEKAARLSEKLSEAAQEEQINA